MDQNKKNLNKKKIYLQKKAHNINRLIEEKSNLLKKIKSINKLIKKKQFQKLGYII